jgi:hypothetical protein
MSPPLRGRGRPWLSWSLLLVITVFSGACGGGAGCGGCGASQPLPAGGVPPDQTVEAGAQVRLTPSGVAKIEELARGTVEGALGQGFCVPSTEIGDAHSTFGTGAYLCRGNQNQCTPGCDVDIAFDSLTFAPAGPQTLRITAQIDAVTSVPLNFQVVGVGGSCTVGVRANNVVINADINVGINGPTGDLRITAGQIPRPSLSLQFSGCSLVSSILNLLSGFLRGYIVDAMLGVLQPTLDNLLRNLLPDPPGVAGAFDVGALLSGVASGAGGALEARLVPGGYVHFTLPDGGLSLGAITAFNADRDPTTRTADLDSEVARCVPALAPPDLAAGPRALPRNPERSTFVLPTAPAFDGAPDPASADLAFGLSETALDLLGHHLVTSGAACLGVGTAQVPRLNLATFGIVSPSLASLGSEDRNDPMLLVTRPTSAVDFAIGDGTAASPSLTLKIDNFDVDVYAFLYERYTRAFTMTLSLQVGLNLEFEQAPGQPVSIKPVLLGVSSRNVRVTVANREFIRESKESLEQVLPAVFDLVTPLLGDLPSIALPAFAGFSLENLGVGKVTTAEDSFLAVTGTLGTPPALAALAQRAPVATAVPPRVVASARLQHVEVPAVAEVRAALDGEVGALPEVFVAVDRFDALGRELEWSWRLDDGLWRPYSAAAPLVIRDRGFAFQGDYSIGLMARVKGDYRTVSEEQRLAVRIDSEAPHLVRDATVWSDDALRVAGFDTVAEREVELAFGAPGAGQPATAWFGGGEAELAAARVAELARGGEVQVFLRDPSGNQQVELVAPLHGQAASGCSCNGGGAGGSAATLLLVLGGLLVRSRRSARAPRARQPRTQQRRLRRGAAALAVTALLPACDCGGAAGRACEVVQDCAGFCGEREVAFCIEGTCVCTDDIAPGRIGPYTDIAASRDGVAWVAAYAQSHGDLVAVRAAPGRVAPERWEWIDGVPDGPIAVANAKIRGGIAEPGPDVGMYPSVAVTDGGEPRISYFDRDSASLRFAAKVGEVWQRHVVDAGTGDLAGATGALVGMYTSLTLRSDDGRPGIAYLAHVKDAAGTHAEVRYASAQVPDPKQASDWLIKVVDTAPLPPASPADPDPYPLPAGLGLFVDSARLLNQAPLVVYYDRSAGQLKLSAFNPTQNRFDPATVLDGGSGDDAGWSPTVAVDAAGQVHVAYVSATRDDLQYLKVGGAALPEIVDDGYRLVGETAGGAPKPEFHFVGDDASLLINLNGQAVVAYQDATSHELLVARRSTTGQWLRTSIAGAEDPFVGAYGFFTAAAGTASTMYLASWVLDPANDEQWVEVFERPITE